MVLRLIPQIFYADLAVGIDLLVAGLGFELAHGDDSLAAVVREAARRTSSAMRTSRRKDRLGLVIETDAIDDVYVDISARRPGLLLAGARVVARRPWRAREFAVRGGSGVCVIFPGWPTDGRIEASGD